MSSTPPSIPAANFLKNLKLQENTSEGDRPHFNLITLSLFLTNFQKCDYFCQNVVILKKKNIVNLR